MPLSLKRQVFDQCVLPTMTYGCQTWSLTKATTQRLRTAQRAMERKMLKAKLKDKIPCREIRAKTNIKDVVKFAAKQKWKWAGHVARLNDNRWTKRITDWQPRYGKRSRGRQVKRWRDDIVQMKGITWGRDAGQRDDWRRDAEGYILQWMDGASSERASESDIQKIYETAYSAIMFVLLASFKRQSDSRPFLFVAARALSQRLSYLGLKPLFGCRAFNTSETE